MAICCCSGVALLTLPSALITNEPSAQVEGHSTADRKEERSLSRSADRSDTPRKLFGSTCRVILIVPISRVGGVAKAANAGPLPCEATLCQLT